MDKNIKAFKKTGKEIHKEKFGDNVDITVSIDYLYNNKEFADHLVYSKGNVKDVESMYSGLLLYLNDESGNHVLDNETDEFKEELLVVKHVSLLNIIKYV